MFITRSPNEMKSTSINRPRRKRSYGSSAKDKKDERRKRHRLEVEEKNISNMSPKFELLGAAPESPPREYLSSPLEETCKSVNQEIGDAEEYIQESLEKRTTRKKQVVSSTSRKHDSSKSKSSDSAVPVPVAKSKVKVDDRKQSSRDGESGREEQDSVASCILHHIDEENWKALQKTLSRIASPPLKTNSNTSCEHFIKLGYEVPTLDSFQMNEVEDKGLLKKALTTCLQKCGVQVVHSYTIDHQLESRLEWISIMAALLLNKLGVNDTLQYLKKEGLIKDVKSSLVNAYLNSTNMPTMLSTSDLSGNEQMSQRHSLLKTSLLSSKQTFDHIEELPTMGIYYDDTRVASVEFVYLNYTSISFICQIASRDASKEIFTYYNLPFHLFEVTVDSKESCLLLTPKADHERDPCKIFFKKLDMGRIIAALEFRGISLTFKAEEKDDDDNDCSVDSDESITSVDSSFDGRTVATNKIEFTSKFLVTKGKNIMSRPKKDSLSNRNPYGKTSADDKMLVKVKSTKKNNVTPHGGESYGRNTHTSPDKELIISKEKKPIDLRSGVSGSKKKAHVTKNVESSNTTARVTRKKRITSTTTLADSVELQPCIKSAEQSNTNETACEKPITSTAALEGETTTSFSSKKAEKKVTSNYSTASGNEQKPRDEQKTLEVSNRVTPPKCKNGKVKPSKNAAHEFSSTVTMEKVVSEFVICNSTAGSSLCKEGFLSLYQAYRTYEEGLDDLRAVVDEANHLGADEEFQSVTNEIYQAFSNWKNLREKREQALISKILRDI